MSGKIGQRKKIEQENKKEDNCKRAKTSRENRLKKLGAPFTINMHDKNKTRLREICVHFGHDDMMERKKATGRIFSQTIMNVIDYYYITAVIESKNDNVKLLINTFKIIWKECVLKKNIFILKKEFEILPDHKEKKTIKKELESIAKSMTEENYFIPPYIVDNNFDKRDITTWTPLDILYLLDTQSVISKIKKLNKLKK
ncbi:MULTISPECIES: hypothetical protein [Morganellaceae]|uniref:hypothetical protein n=1 Tax=Morganellaceae TaxID=1903414 RepID=UPI000F7800FC|nr:MULTISPECIES: hypothetical protein [Morganellaceae]EEJ3798575.1 hypothetical protein [Salmonella enterica subsp. enterica serovar Gaminara]ELN4245796.1 hypothetical protein [Proteus mirabilis]ELN4569469.1 hypothetical protein [Proteus mirabilis]MBV2189789.1 hypothetical protein [Providencia rettgeri]MCZ4671772.1 hypothetical protein [Proteus mirabilis]